MIDEKEQREAEKSRREQENELENLENTIGNFRFKDVRAMEAYESRKKAITAKYEADIRKIQENAQKDRIKANEAYVNSFRNTSKELMNLIKSSGLTKAEQFTAIDEVLKYFRENLSDFPDDLKVIENSWLNFKSFMIKEMNLKTPFENFLESLKVVSDRAKDWVGKMKTEAFGAFLQDLKSFFTSLVASPEEAMNKFGDFFKNFLSKFREFIANVIVEAKLLPEMLKELSAVKLEDLPKWLQERGVKWMNEALNLGIQLQNVMYGIKPSPEFNQFLENLGINLKEPIGKIVGEKNLSQYFEQVPQFQPAVAGLPQTALPTGTIPIRETTVKEVSPVNLSLNFYGITDVNEIVRTTERSLIPRIETLLYYK